MRIVSARKCITPQGKFFPCYLCGHAMRTELAVGVADDLWVNCIRLVVEEEQMVWLSFELVGFDPNNTKLIQKTVAEKYHIAENQVIVSFVHTHSAPEYANESPFFGAERMAIKGYPEFLVEQALLAVDECFEQEPVEVRCFMRQFDVDGYYGNRNGKDAVADKAMTTLLFKDEKDVVVASIVQVTCHPTVLGPQNFYVSGDLAGYLCRELQTRLGVYPFFMQGAAGDTSNRLYRQGNDYKELRRIGDGIIAQWELHPEETELNVSSVEVKTVDYVREFTLDVEAKKRNVADIERRIAEAKTFDEKKVYTSALAVAKATVNIDHSKMDFHAQLIKMGDLFIFSLPAELFACFGHEIKRAMNVKCPMIWGYCNYSVGYLVDRAEFGRSFESACSDIPEGTSEEIVEQVIYEITNK